jgi:hypothetical protein
MYDAIVTLVEITDRLFNTYNNNERWVVKKMRSEYDNRIVSIMPIMYRKDKVQYFNNNSAMMISRVDHRKFVNWATIMFFNWSRIDQMGEVSKKYD